MTSADEVRTIALGLENVWEVDHHGRPTFRTKTRIFAVIRADGLWLYLPPERKAFLFAADPEAFVCFMWGKQPELLVQCAAISRDEMTELLQEAWGAAQPKKRVSSPKNRGMR